MPSGDFAILLLWSFFAGMQWDNAAGANPCSRVRFGHLLHASWRDFQSSRYFIDPKMVYVAEALTSCQWLVCQPLCLSTKSSPSMQQPLTFWGMDVFYRQVSKPCLALQGAHASEVWAVCTRDGSTILLQPSWLCLRRSSTSIQQTHAALVCILSISSAK